MNNEPDYKDNLAVEPEMTYREFNFWCRTLEGGFIDKALTEALTAIIGVK